MDGDGWVWVRRPADDDEEERPLKVVFDSPAEHFTDAAPIGNGSLGAMVWGSVASEKLQLNRTLPLAVISRFLGPVDAARKAFDEMPQLDYAHDSDSLLLFFFLMCLTAE
jgi:hypothetical protein